MKQILIIIGSFLIRFGETLSELGTNILDKAVGYTPRHK